MRLDSETERTLQTECFARSLSTCSAGWLAVFAEIPYEPVKSNYLELSQNVYYCEE